MRNFQIKIFLLLLAALSAYACALDDTLILPGEEELPPPALSSYKEGMVRIKLTEELAGILEQESGTRGVVGSPAAGLSVGVFSELGIKHLKRTFPYAGEFEERTRAEGMHLWYDVFFDPEVAVTRAGTCLGAVRGVEKVEYRPQLVYFGGEITPLEDAAALIEKEPSANTLFDDPMLPQQWHYLNDGSLPKSVAGADINVVPVWENFTTGSPDVIVAVVDGGIDFEHEDLVANLWINEAELHGESGVDSDGNGYADDIYGYNFALKSGTLAPHDHGTHVAGVIAAQNNNGKGVCGIAGGDMKKGLKGARLMSCQILTAEGKWGDTAEAIKYGADNGAVICQNSWGYNKQIQEIFESDRIAIDYFIKYAGIDKNGIQTGPMRGGILLFSAGNDDYYDGYPAKYEKVLAISAIGGDYVKAWYSNYGTWVDVAAPGGDSNKEFDVWSTITTRSGGYGKKEGTSMACPHVSGVAALIVSEFGGTGFTPYMLKSMLLNSTTPIDSYNQPLYKGKMGGLVNAYNAFTRKSTTPPDDVADLSLAVNSNNAILVWSVPRDPDEIKPIGFNVYYSDRSFTPDNTAPLPSHVRSVVIHTEDVKVGEAMKTIIGDLDFNKEYYFSIDAFDMFGNRSSMASVQRVTTAGNNAPVISPGDDIDIVLKSHERFTKQLSISDSDWHELTRSLSSGLAGLTVSDVGEGLVEIAINALEAPSGTYKGKLSVSDKYGLSAAVNISYVVGQNRAPVMVRQPADIMMRKNAASVIYELNDYFNDEDGEELKYSVETDTDIVAGIDLSGGILTFTPMDYGMATVKITASDERGESVFARIRVLVSNYNNGVDIYPNPVTDKMYIRVFRETKARVKITSNSGGTLHDRELLLSPFEPTLIDMSRYDAGVYRLVIVVDGREIIRNIVKV